MVKMGEYLSVQSEVYGSDFVPAGTVSFSTMSGASVSATTAVISGLYGTFAELTGSITAAGDAVLGSSSGATVKMDGTTGEYAITYTGSEMEMSAGGETMLRFSDTGGTMYGDWTTEDLTVSGVSPAITFKDTSTRTSAKMKYVEGGVQITAQGQRLITAGFGASTLHGRWVASDVITLSDQRLKRNIRSLNMMNEGKPVEGDAQVYTQAHAGPAWLLRQLRPISYHFRHEDEGKRTSDSLEEEVMTEERYGFVADEVQEVLPSLVRTVKHSSRGDVKGVAQQDMLALAIAALQTMQAQMEGMAQKFQVQVDGLAHEVAALRAELTGRV